jgi:hypothetical protein
MKKIVAVGALLVGLIVWRAHANDAPDAKLLYDRYWVDHEPRGIHEPFQGLYVSGEHPVGNFAARTVWTGQWEGFHYHVVPREDATFDALFPNNGEIQRIRYVARRCQENGFDFCLEITGSSRGVQRYFSKKAWAGMSNVDFDRR